MAKSRHKRIATRLHLVTARDVKEGARVMREQGKAAHARWLKRLSGRGKR